jgi:hypothetical protein
MIQLRLNFLPLQIYVWTCCQDHEGVVLAKKDIGVLMKAYQKVGLDEAFSKAIVDGGNASHIVETWKAEWRGEHGAEHPAIRSVLEGHATPDEARSLLEAADDHRDLVESVAAGAKTMKWAHTVLNAGFKGKKEAISALLDGADPVIIADILDVKLSDADAKAIGRSCSRRKKVDRPKEGITIAMIKKMNKTSCVAELALGGVPYTGNSVEVRDKLLRYRSFLKCIIRGLKCGKLVWLKQPVIHHPIKPLYYYRQRDRVLETVSYSGKIDLNGLREAGKQLRIKGAYRMSKKNLLTKILNQGLRFGLVDEDDYEDLLDGKIINSDSDFKKN